ncbi:MAG: hypothetical protein J5517_06120 [Eubacterium sp.]|nr:hypothetical protein [Eubacterium sp.]
MNVSTAIALIVIVLLVTMACIYLYKNGTCGSCPDHAHCSKKLLKSLNKKCDCGKKEELIDDIMKKHGV